MHVHLKVKPNFLPCRQQAVKEIYAIHFRALIIKIHKIPTNASY